MKILIHYQITYDNQIVKKMKLFFCSTLHKKLPNDNLKENILFVNFRYYYAFALLQMAYQFVKKKSVIKQRYIFISTG